MNTTKRINQLRAGVIGTGFIGPVHIEALRRLGVQVVALCDVPAVVKAAAERLGIPNAYSDYHELLASADVDVVHIASPNNFTMRCRLRDSKRASMSSAKSHWR